jgi:molecular chaperone DnaK
VPILPRNTPLPASKSEMVYTLYDNQTSAKVEVHQGESERPEQNTFIGDFLVEGLSQAPEGNPIVIHFDLDLNGILKVTATEKVTGLAKTVALDTKGQHLLNLDEARRNIASLVGEPGAEGVPAEEAVAGNGHGESQADEEELLTSAKELRKRAEALLQKSIGEDDANEIRELIHASAVAIKDKDWNTLKEKNEAISDLLFYLED